MVSVPCFAQPAMDLLADARRMQASADRYTALSGHQLEAIHWHLQGQNERAIALLQSEESCVKTMCAGMRAEWLYQLASATFTVDRSRSLQLWQQAIDTAPTPVFREHFEFLRASRLGETKEQRPGSTPIPCDYVEPLAACPLQGGKSDGVAGAR